MAQWIDTRLAFLQGHLDEEVYMSQPPGFEDEAFPSHICRLRRAIYGLKQAPRAWYNELKTHLFSLGFLKSESNNSLFIRHCSVATIYILVYVNDIMITGSNSAMVNKVISSLALTFSIKHLGTLNYFLGVEVL